jgi:hypothetical protein
MIQSLFFNKHPKKKPEVKNKCLKLTSKFIYKHYNFHKQKQNFSNLFYLYRKTFFIHESQNE